MLIVWLLEGCSGTPSSSLSPPQTSAEDFLATMSDRDIELANRTVQQALEKLQSGASLSWQNPDNNHSGSVSPLRTYQTKTHTFCRIYSETFTLGDETRRFEGTACRDDAGVWQPI
jgi:surface antigen